MAVPRTSTKRQEPNARLLSRLCPSDSPRSIWTIRGISLFVACITVLIAFVLFPEHCGAIFNSHSSLDSKAPTTLGVSGEPCNIERRTELTCEEFVSDFLGRKPVVFTRPKRTTTTTATEENENEIKTTSECTSARVSETFTESTSATASTTSDVEEEEQRQQQQQQGRVNRKGSSLSEFAQLTERESLLRRFGHESVRVSTANSYTGKEWHHITLSDYLSGSDAQQQDKSKGGNETWYLFGGGEWPGLLDHYQGAQLPSEGMVQEQELLEVGGKGGERVFMGAEGEREGAEGSGQSRSLSVLKRAAMDMCTGGQTALDRINDFITLSFGIAGKDTGVPFHFHGPGFLQVIHGRKRWFLYPPDADVDFDPNATTVNWVDDVYASLKPEHKPHECVVHEGEFIYFPDKWWHATLNLDTFTVFVASFA